MNNVCVRLHVGCIQRVVNAHTHVWHWRQSAVIDADLMSCLRGGGLAFNDDFSIRSVVRQLAASFSLGN